MNNKGFASVALMLAIGVVVIVGGYFAYTSQTNTIDESSFEEGSSGELVRDCPEEWYDNQMPTTFDPDEDGTYQNASQYFVYNGERRELSEFDMEWVDANCEIEPQVVQ